MVTVMLERRHPSGGIQSAGEIPRATRRQRKQLARREKLRSQAIAMFRARGVGATSIEAITERCDIGKGTFFNYFENKEAVLSAHYSELKKTFNEELKDLDPGKPIASLFYFFWKIERLFRQEGKLLYALYRAWSAREVLSERDRKSQKPDLEEYRLFLKSAVKAGTLSPQLDPELVATLICDVWQGSLIDWLAAEQKHSLASAIREKLQYLLGESIPAGK